MLINFYSIKLKELKKKLLTIKSFSKKHIDSEE